MHRNSRLMFERYVTSLLRDGMRVLEIGPDGFPSTYASSANPRVLDWHTLDIYDNPGLTYPGSGEYSFPVSSGSYDMVISGQVIEHVRKPWLWIAELARVVRPGGRVVTIGPVSWPYHEAPVDCWRIYPEGMRALYETAGLSVDLCRWESLESPGFRRYRPGVSHESMRKAQRVLNRMSGWVGLPFERSYDTITIGTK